MDRPLFWYFPHYSGGLGGRPAASIREGDFKLIYHFEGNRSELFHLKKDEGKFLHSLINIREK